jgi:hypothetical protein
MEIEPLNKPVWRKKIESLKSLGREEEARAAMATSERYACG